MTPEEIAAMQEENRTLKALVTELLPLREQVKQQALLIAQLQQQV
jgi:transposase